MSETASALSGARYVGLVRIEESGLQGMIALRGDLSAAGFKKAVTAAAGTAIPGKLQATLADGGGLLWMSPDELLLLCRYEEAPAKAAKLSKALARSHALAADVSDARAVFRVSGKHAREVLAKLCPVDFSPEAFGQGTFRRTRLAQVPAGIWMAAENEFRVICFRSVAQYAFDLLKAAGAREAGVSYF